MNIRYNLFIFFGRVIFITLLLAVPIVFFLLWEPGAERREPFVLIFGALLIPVFLVSLMRSIRLETYDITFQDDRFILRRPIIGTTKTISFSEIKGYSKSKVNYGSRWGMSLSESKSVILYQHHDKPMEFISFNYFKFGNLEPALREAGIKYLGEEKYTTGLLWRKFQFEVDD